MEFGIIITQILKLILLVLVGVFVQKKHILPDGATDVLAKVMLNITLPLLTFFSITSYRLPEDILQEGLFIIIMAIVVILFSLGIGIFVANKIKLEAIKKHVFAAQLMIGNTVFLAFPLMQTLYGEIGLIYAIVYYLVSLTFIWTLGIYLFNKHNIKSMKQIVGSLVNPCTVSFLIGILALLLKIDIAIDQWPTFGKIYQFSYDTFYPLGNTTMSLSMIFIGLIVGKMDIKSMISTFKTKSIVWMLVIKMVMIPLVFIVILRLVSGFASEVAVGVIFIETLMPASSITVAIAKENGSDYKYAMEIAMATTIIAVITIPVLLEIFNAVQF